MMKAVSAADAIADFFLLKQDSEVGDFMTHMKLQKLVYYVQAWYAATTGKRAFSEQVKAWKDGPVIPKLYHRFKVNGDNLIDASQVITDPFHDLPQSVRYVSNEVLKELGGLSGSQLRKRTHDESPWREAYGDRAEGEVCQEPIPISSMEDFYRKQLKIEFFYGVNLADKFEVEPEFEHVEGQFGTYMRVIVPVGEELRRDTSKRLEIENEVHGVIEKVAPHYVGGVSIRYRTDARAPKTVPGICRKAA